MGVGVRQQTVSRWESGESRPRGMHRAKLAELFGVTDPDGLPSRTGGRFVERSGVTRPVRPLANRLPLWRLSWEAFEGFCRELVMLLYPDARVYRYGGPGQVQGGIDLVAEMPDGTVVAYQCKRVKHFGPKKLRSAVASTEFEGDRFVLLLSRSASAELRREALRYPTWDVEDAEDISATIRYDLPSHAGKRLADTYFPGWAKDFLGISRPGIWMTTDEYFRPLLRPTAVISQGWTLVGRSEELAAVDRFVASDQQTLMLTGRGGIGKTRLLFEIATRIGADIPVFFLAPDTKFRPEDMELLPAGRFVAVVDDAHNRDDVLALLSALSRHPSQGWKLVLATRPYSKDKLVGDLRVHGLLRLDEEGVIHLEDLEIDDTEALASEVISQQDCPTDAARLVAGATRDCPLFTVIAAKLVANKRVDPRHLASDETARSLLIRQFKNALIRELGEPHDRPALMQLLELVALVQPITVDDEEFRDLAESLLGQHPNRVLRGLRTLEEAGVVARRGAKLRVTPDLFGDFLVADACVDPVTGSPTGYAEAVFEKAYGAIAQNVITSVARLDWRASRERQWDSTVLDRIWDSLTRDLVASTALGREAKLSSLSEVSYYQPRRSLDLVKKLLRTPPRPEDRNLGLPEALLADVGHRLNGITKFLRNAGYSLEHVGEVCDLLWAIGRDHEGWLSADPDHAIRILQKLASIESDKPREYLSVIADRAIAWTTDPDLGIYRHSPLDVLEPLVATDSRDTETRGLTVRIRPFVINPDAVRPLRNRSINTAISLLAHPSLRVGVRAARFLYRALRYPSSQFGREPTSGERSSWTDVFCDEFEQLATFLEENRVDPIVGEEVRQAVRWHATYGDDTKEPADSVLAVLGGGLCGQLTRALAYGWADEHPGLDRQGLDYHEVQAEWRSIQRRLVQRLRHEAGDPVPAVDMVEERVRSLAQAESRAPSSAEPFLSILCNEWEEVTAEILSRVATPSSPLRPYTRIALSELRNHHPQLALELTRQLIDTRVPELVAQVADALTRHTQSGTPTIEELTMIGELAKHDEPAVRLAVARGLRLTSGIDHPTRLGLITTTPICGDLSVAAAIVDHFDPHGEFNLRDAPPEFIPRVLEGLVPCETLDDCTISNFLAEASARDPHKVLDLYMSRVNHQQTEEAYTPLPFHSQHRPPLRFRESGHFKDVVHRVCDWMLESHDDWHRSFWAPQLFAASVGCVDQQVLDHLDHWAGTTDPQGLQVVAHLLCELPGNFVWEVVDWVNDLLERAYAFGDDCYNNVSAALRKAVESGVTGGQVGQPFPEDIEQRDRSLSVAAALRVGSSGHRFYTSLAKSAEASIRWTQQLHDEMRDGP